MSEEVEKKSEATAAESVKDSAVVTDAESKAAADMVVDSVPAEVQAETGEPVLDSESLQEMDDEFVDKEPDRTSAPQKEYVPITVKTQVNLDTRAALARNMILSNWLPFAILAGLLMMLGAILWITMDNEDVFIGISVLILGLLVPAGVYGLTLLLAKYNAKKTAGATSVKTVTLTFGDSITGVEEMEGAPEKQIAYDYEVVYRVRESKRYFFLFVDSRSAIVVSKEGVVSATVADLKELLEAKCTHKQIAS